MIGAILGGAQIGLGLYDAYNGRKEAKRQNRLAEAEAERLREREERNDEITNEQYARHTRLQDEEEARYNELYRPVEEQLARDVLEGEDIESAAREAEGDFIGQYDRSLEASRREQARRGVDPNSSAAASFEEDQAFNRARGAATATTDARRIADDENFIQRATFLNSGSGLRDRAMSQFGGRLGTSTASYGIRADRADAAHNSSVAGFAGIGQGLAALSTGIQPRAASGDASKPNLNIEAAETPGGIRSRTTQGVNGAIAAQTRVNP